MIDLETARRIAYAWHGGGGSPLYSFASTGDVANITPDTVSEVDEDRSWCINNANTDEAKDGPRLDQLRAFLIANMPPQDDDKDA